LNDFNRFIAKGGMPGEVLRKFPVWKRLFTLTLKKSPETEIWRNEMKKILASAVCLLLIGVYADVFATPISVNMTVSASSPTAFMKFPSETSEKNWYADYDLNLTFVAGAGWKDGWYQAFCVSDQGAAAYSGQLHELPNGQNSLTEAAWLIDKYFTSGAITPDSSEHAALQMAIWEVTIDPGNYNLTQNLGSVWSTDGKKSTAQSYVDDLKAQSTLAFSGNYTYGYVTDNNSKQDFLVYKNAAPVPEPATMLLLGSGLVGLAAAGRRKFLKK
jgi:hypothetical protein